jgi:hypothetical protein
LKAASNYAFERSGSLSPRARVRRARYLSCAGHALEALAAGRSTRALAHTSSVPVKYLYVSLTEVFYDNRKHTRHDVEVL